MNANYLLTLIVDNILQCSVTCGAGTRQRNVTCTSSSAVLPERVCDASLRPDSVQECMEKECNSGFVWRSDQWSEVSQHSVYPSPELCAPVILSIYAGLLKSAL